MYTHIECVYLYKKLCRGLRRGSTLQLKVAPIGPCFPSKLCNCRSDPPWDLQLALVTPRNCATVAQIHLGTMKTMVILDRSIIGLCKPW